MIRYNVYVFPKGNDTNEIRGNITSKIPINDTMVVSILLLHERHYHLLYCVYHVRVIINQQFAALTKS